MNFRKCARCGGEFDVLSNATECSSCQKDRSDLYDIIAYYEQDVEISNCIPKDSIFNYVNKLATTSHYRIPFIKFIVNHIKVDTLIHKLNLTRNDCEKCNFGWDRYRNICKNNTIDNDKNNDTISRQNVEDKSNELTRRVADAFNQLRRALPAELVEYMAPGLDIAADKAAERISIVVRNEIMTESLGMNSDESIAVVEPNNNQNINDFIYLVVREGIPKITLATNIEQTPLIFTDERMYRTHNALVEEGVNIEIANRKSNTVFYAINDLNSTVIKCGFHTGSKEALHNRYRTSGDFEIIYIHRSDYAREFETKFHALMKRYNVSRSSFDRKTDNSEWYSCDRATLLRGIAAIEDHYRQRFASDMINRFYQKIEAIQSSSI
jgi:hypothetical protein